MSHLSLDQLLELREPGLEPGLAAAREHLAGCAVCQAEAARLDQRSARLRALPSLRPARSHWPELSRRLGAEAHRRRLRWAATLGAALAAGVALVVMTRLGDRRHGTAGVALDSVMARSTQLEQLIQSYNPDARVTDGATALVAGELEDRIAQVDQQLEVTQLADERERDQQLLALWRRRVGLLDALVDVHLTQARRVGF
jgi:hypothetical protein